MDVQSGPPGAWRGWGGKNLLVTLGSWASLPGTHHHTQSILSFLRCLRGPCGCVYVPSAISHLVIVFFPSAFDNQRPQGCLPFMVSTMLYSRLVQWAVSHARPCSWFVYCLWLLSCYNSRPGEIDRSVWPEKPNILLSASCVTCAYP